MADSTGHELISIGIEKPLPL